MKKILYLGILCTLLLSACNDDDKEEITPSRDMQMLVVNEGINGEGGLSVVYGDGTIDVNAYEKANERILQGSPYAINSINDKYFLTASAPARIEVLDPTTLAVLGTIEYEKIGMPRDIIPISESEAIVADSIHQLTKINTVTNSIVKHMTLAEEWGMEEIAVVNNKLFGTHLDASGIAVFDIDNITGNPQSVIPVSISKNVKTCKMHVDKNNKLWIFSTGKNAENRNCAYWIKIDPVTQKVDSVEIPFFKRGEEKLEIGVPVGATYNKSYLSTDKATIYFTLQACARISSGQGRLAIFALDVNDNTYKLYRETPGVEARLNGMGISPEGDVYLCDANGTLSGFVRHFPANETISAIRVGIKPRMIWFPR